MSIFDGFQFCLEVARAKANPVRDLIDDGISVQDPPRWMRSRFFHPFALLAMTIAMFADVLLSSGGRVLSSFGQDLSTEFVYWRQFGFAQLRAGHLALWNPHVFSGVPFMGGFQAALLYPPNWIYLVLPLATAINLEIALHVFLLGLFMAMWTKRYALHPLAILFAASIVMFGGSFFLHIYPGHLATLDAMAWAPLILLTVDELIDDPQPKWILAGIFAVAMQILAGHPQTAFNTFVACAIYGAISLINARRPLWTVLAIVMVGIGAISIDAVQIWTGIQAAGEGTRHGGVTFEFASMLSLPPENFLTLLVPGFFGNISGLPYWGRWSNLWELWPFFGLTGLSMAIFGATISFPKRRACIASATVLYVIAMGAYTPLLGLLFHYVPGFNQFRSHSKFIFEGGLFLGMLAAAGADSILRSKFGAKRLALSTVVAGLILGAIGICLWAGFSSSAELWTQLVNAIASNTESHMSSDNYATSEFIVHARTFAGTQCLISAAILIFLAAMLWMRTINSKAAYALVGFGIVEIFVFARSTVATFQLAQSDPVALREFVKTHPGDYRILELPGDGNRAMVAGAQDIWGYDPMVERRYSELLSFSQHQHPDDATMYVLFRSRSPLWRLLRLRYIFRPRNDSTDIIAFNGGLPHLLLISDWKRITNRDEILSAMRLPSFDPLSSVILETDPNPAPAVGPPSGTVELVGSDTDSLTISASVSTPALLLITDGYSKYWRAVSMPGSSQHHYDVLPADYTLMGVPLSPGKHLFRVEYAPSGYIIGRWISLVALAAYLFAIGVYLRRYRSID